MHHDPHHHPQFDPRQAMKDRPFERMLLLHRTFGKVVKAIGYAGLTLMVWPRFFAPHRLQIVRLPMPMQNLPSAWAGRTILQLSDLHLGATNYTYALNAIRQGLALKPDIIVITGDLIEYGRAGLCDLAAIMPLLQAPHGVYAIFGNHDYHEYSWRHVGERSSHRAIHKRLCKLLLGSQVQLLRNQAVAVKRDGQDLWLVGMNELWTQHMYPHEAFASVPADAASICLLHNADGFPLVCDYPWQWMLSGHTHGGQVNLPGVGPLYVPVEHREWLRGYYALHNSSGQLRNLYVSTGLGYSTKVRWLVPPEITLWELQPVNAST